MTNRISKGRYWTGWILSGIVILFMLFDSITKLMKTDQVVEGTTDLGYAEHHLLAIGILGLASIILYAIPRTSILGAVLLTGYLGGAVASNMRMDYELFGYILFPVYLGVVAWIGLWLKDNRVRKFCL